MRYDPSDEERLRRYLLGKLPEEEADSLEERLLRDDELFELSEAVEADLLAALDRGELTPEEQERVLRRLASSPQGRERLAFARALNAEARPPAPPGAMFPRRAPFVRWTAMAAGLLAAAGLSWYALERRPGGETPSRTYQEHPAVAGPVTSDLQPPPPSPSPVTPPSPIAQGNPPPTPAPKPANVVFELALMTVRGAESAPPLTLPAGAETVEIRLGVEEMEDFASFNLVLRNPSGQAIVDKSGVKPRTVNGVRTLVVEIPAGRLTPGRYEVEAQGVAPGSEPQAFSPVPFEVVSGSKR